MDIVWREMDITRVASGLEREEIHVKNIFKWFSASIFSRILITISAFISNEKESFTQH